jgi:ABC-2 type transport system permease protein
VFYLLKKDCKEFFDNKKRIVGILIVLIILIIGTYCNMTNQTQKKQEPVVQFGVVDMDDSDYSKLLLKYFKESESFSSYINIIQGSKEEINKAFKEGKLDIVLTIPEKFAENMIYLEHLPVKVVINTTDTTKAIFLKNILESYEKYISAVEINCVTLYDTMSKSKMDSKLIDKKNIEISYDLIFTALGKEEFFRYEEIGNFPSTTILNYYLSAILAILLMYSALYVGFQLMKEKQEGTLRRLHTTGLPISTVLFEKIIFSATVIFTITMITYLLPKFAQGAPINIKIAIFYLCFIILCISFAILISGIFHKIQNYMIIGNFISFLFIIIGGGIIPIMYLPTELVNLAKLTPVYWFINLSLLIQNGIEQGAFIKLILVLLAGTLLFSILSKVAYSRETVFLEE